MKIFLVKRDPDRPACSDNWISMNSSQFSSFLRTQEGRSRSRSFGILESCGDDSQIVIETDRGTAEELRYQRNRNCYVKRSLRQALQRYGMHIVRPQEDDTPAGQTSECCSLQDPSLSVEEQVERKMDLQLLREAVGRLERDERTLIMYCVAGDEPLTESMYGEIAGMSREEVHSMKRRVLRKLRRYMQEGYICV